MESPAAIHCPNAHKVRKFIPGPTGGRKDDNSRALCYLLTVPLQDPTGEHPVPFADTFLEIAAILSLATVLGVLGQKLRQPLIIMFLAAGILAGPAALGIIQSYEQIDLLADIGIALLLFIVGLKLDLNLIRTTGPVALATGLGQILFTSAIGFGIAIALNLDLIGAAYVAVALTFSSTIIIVKLLSDKKEIDALHGQIAVGFLIVQDIAAILALVLLTTFGTQVAEEASVLWSSLFIVFQGLALLAAVGLLMKFVLPGLTRRLAHSQEILTLFAIAWAVCLGAGSELLGFSKEVGAFLAGISLASTDFRDAIGARLTTLRDFLLLFFFIDLGARLDWATVGDQILPAIWLSLFVLIGNPLIVLAIMGFMGYRRRTAFLAGLTVAQISEFSLIVAALGLSIGHITAETMGLITLVGVATIFASTYLILYSGPLYERLAGPLKVFERRNPHRETAIDTLHAVPSVDVILLGLGNYGSSLAAYLLGRRKTLLGVDFDPGVLAKWRNRGMTVLYADIMDPEAHEHLPINHARWVVSTIRSPEINLSLLERLQTMGYAGKIALTAANEEEAERFDKAGAHVTFRPFVDAAEQAADALTHAMDVLPEKVDWPIAFGEVRVRTGSTVAGQTVRELPLRAATGVSILAVSRAGQVHYDLQPDFRIYPGDRLVIMGPAEGLRRAETLLNQTQKAEGRDSTDRFEAAEIRISDDSPLAGQTLAEARFRQKHGVTVVGIRRGKEKINTPAPTEQLARGDCLIVIGNKQAVESLNQSEAL
jgi:predicted Kef-type K+ transport protein/Trk K+ transport system NAD-binding subunit